MIKLGVEPEDDSRKNKHVDWAKLHRRHMDVGYVYGGKPRAPSYALPLRITT